MSVGPNGNEIFSKFRAFIKAMYNGLSASLGSTIRSAANAAAI